jgi:hypothetical protein
MELEEYMLVLVVITHETWFTHHIWLLLQNCPLQEDFQRLKGK